jgi:hypothetical protein
LEESEISLPQCTQNMKSPPVDGHSNGVTPSELPSPQRHSNAAPQAKAMIAKSSMILATEKPATLRSYMSMGSTAAATVKPNSIPLNELLQWISRLEL